MTETGNMGKSSEADLEEMLRSAESRARDAEAMMYQVLSTVYKLIFSERTFFLFDEISMT